MNNSTWGGTRRQNGGVLITALIFTAIISLFALGVAMIATSHLSRSTVEADYATAIQLADAGINHEIRFLSADTSNPAQAHQEFPGNGQPGAYVGTMTGIPGGGSFRVSVMNLDGSGPWAAPNPIRIRSTGTVNGISRTVEITGKRAGIFGEYAIYSTVSGSISGNNSIIHGNVGTNGAFAFNGGAATPNIQGELTFNGFPANNPVTNPGADKGFEEGPNVWWNPDPVQWPTVDEIANQLFPQGGLSWLKTNNSNANVKQFNVSDPNSLIANAITFGISTAVLDNQSFSRASTSQNVEDKVGGNRYQNGYEGLFGRNVLIFGPGDYYLKGVKLTNTANNGILIDNASGMVRIWIDGGNAKDSLDLPVMFTSTDKNKFRLYYNNCNELSILGNSTFNGSIYAHRDGCTSAIKIGGNSTVNGSVIGMEIVLQGNSVINFPNNGAGSADDDFTLFYGFANTWREINPSGGAVFPDGTSR